jgi:hypothetical protein
MNIYFKTMKLRKQCSEERHMHKTYGPRMCELLRRRLMELGAADTLADIMLLPQPRCHELTNRNGVFSVDLEYPRRLLFIAANEPVPRKKDSGIDLQRVTEIEVIDVEDTHDKKYQRRGRK